ncbi:MAG: hypothetical protein WB562_08905 [Candidatus Sulfotelmatobacter sp.]
MAADSLIIGLAGLNELKLQMNYATGGQDGTFPIPKIDHDLSALAALAHDGG